MTPAIDPSLYSKEIAYLRDCGNLTTGTQKLIAEGIQPKLIWELWKAAHPSQSAPQPTTEERQRAIHASLARERARRLRKAAQQRHRLGSVQDA